MLDVEVDLTMSISTLGYRALLSDDRFTLLVILGPRVSRLASSA